MKQYILRVCRVDGTSYDGFQWPTKVGATVSAPDFTDTEECGNGLHGWLHGAGILSVDYWRESGAPWYVLSTTGKIIKLDGKVKFESCKIEFVGAMHDAANYLIEHDKNCDPSNVIGRAAIVGDDAIVSVGLLGTATAGDGGSATAGDRGTATAGDRGTASAGYRGTASAGDGGTATAGDGGELRIKYYDAKADRMRTAIAYVGENGIEPNVPYTLDGTHNFVRAE